MATEPGCITSRQIEAARIAMTRKPKGVDRFDQDFPDTPVSKKPAEVRMGKGKGSVDHYAAKVRPGRMLYEMKGIDPETLKELLNQ